ncbi:hypothetical protein H2200_010737 [Cladophialophora chaetospira]|uniref:DUF7066 domain-containing protein n=1 Tax=Cladophialophora chaetospira TaxID=386627 RepID=A0AA38X0N2_9EURO|nr:hypothetical protein H2200_010737 [Cladophialophora chaetospira]
MAINWRLRSNVFQLLAAVYSELGEEAFKGRYASIAQYFGPEASYDAIKSFFAKEVSKASCQLKAQAPHHRGSGRGIPTRSSAGPSRRPPHLYFDDEDISILTQREIEAVEARFGHSLRAPAKRPRVIKASPPPSPEPEVVYSAPVSVSLDEPDPAPSPGPPPNPARTNHVAGVPSHSTVQSDAYYTAPEDVGPSRKRRVSEVQDSIEPDTTANTRQSATPQSESFGYVTNQGQYRCALCLSQLPSQEDLNRHEQVSQEHLRNLRIAAKLARGREKLAQVTRVLEARRHHNTPVPLQPLRMQGIPELSRPQVQSDQSDATGRRESSVQATPSDTIEVRQACVTNEDEERERFASPAQGYNTMTTPAPQPEPENTVNKGKARAISIASSAPPMQPPPRLEASQLRTPSQPPFSPDTRPTTARTEIGTLNTPHTAKTAFMPPPQQVQDHPPRGTANVPGFSTTDIADIMRSTEIMIQLIGHVQKEAKAVAEAHSENTSFDSGIQLRDRVDEEGNGQDTEPYKANSASESETLDASSSGSAAKTHSQTPLQAPGIEVFHGLKRQRGDVGGRGKRNKRQDTGSEVSFIVLE